jgi:formylglycine-generating enzyme required for sulfatase activity
MTHGEPALVRSRRRALGQKTCASSRPWGMGYTVAVIRRRLLPSLLVALAVVVGVSSRGLFAQDADAGDDDDDDAAEVRPSASDAGVTGCEAPRVRVDRDGRCCLPGQRWREGRCAGAVTSCAPGESLTASGGCARRARRDGGATTARFEAAAGVAPTGMVHVPGGVFQAGALTLEVGPFFIDRTEVTVGAYQRCVDEGVCASPVDPFGQMRRPELPVVNVTHAMAMAYCGWTGGRLPTAAEWLLAARGYEPQRFPWGERAAHCGLARLAGCGEGALAPGAVSADRSEFGLVDVVGNVSEWTLDGPLAPRPSGGVLRDPVGASPDGRVMVRGGSFWRAPAEAELHRAMAVDAREARVDRGMRCARGT